MGNNRHDSGGRRPALSRDASRGKRLSPETAPGAGKARVLRDGYGRVITYMRISVTDRCNMRCTYCTPSGGFKSAPHSDILTYEEILRIVRISSGIGVNKFRITGGEPLVRKGVVDLVSRIGELDSVEVTFTTNGLLLEEMAGSLRDAGVRRLNISLDSLRPDRLKAITGIDCLGKVMRGVEKAVELGFDPIKLNMVVMKGVNDDEIMDFVELARNRPFNVRFIEFMPMKENEWDRGKFIPAREIEEMVGRKYPLVRDPGDGESSPSRNFLIDGFTGKIGFISPVSRHFCDSCNRIRLTSDGHIRSCLIREGEVDIKTPMREGAGDEEIEKLISRAVVMKPAGHLLDDDTPRLSGPFRAMTQIGG